MSDTIAAISTPLGVGGIGIVRLSGSDSIPIAEKIFRSPRDIKLSESPSHRIYYGHIVHPHTEEIIDEVLVSVMKAPRTYTREDIVEINCHGGPLAVRRVLELVLEQGARLAGPGEFTQRAFLNGRIDLTQAEAVADIINALTVEEQKSALMQLRGSVSRKIEDIRREVIDLTAIIEAYIDFPEEDIEPPSMNEMMKRAEDIRSRLTDLIEGAKEGVILREGVKTAIIGLPNVGKSSLLNALLDQDRAIVTEIPGTTRDVIEEFVNIKGIPFRIMDTAGIRDVEDIAEKEGVRRSIKVMEEADLVLLVLDAGRGMGDMDRELIGKSKKEHTIIVINKIDLNKEIYEKFNGFPVVKISAKFRQGLDELKRQMVETILGGKHECRLDVITNIRHVNALKRTLSSVQSFIDGLKEGNPPEILSIDLHEALDALGEILGITTPEDILNHIFANFCIGK